MASINFYREQLDNFGWVVIPVIDALLGLKLREMLEPCKELAWNSNYKFPQRTYMNELSEQPLKPFIDLQNLNLANKIMGGDYWRFSPWENTSCLVPAPPRMLYWCREHRDFLDDSKPYHPLDLWLSEFNNPLCFWRANLNLSPEDDDYLWIERSSHKWINLIHEKERVLRPRFVPENQNSGEAGIVRQFEEELARTPQIEQIVVPPFAMVIMRSTLIHRGGLYKYEQCKIGKQITRFGRLTLHFAVENDVHINIRNKIAGETIKQKQNGIKWTDRCDAELNRLSITSLSY